ncbi:MAG: methyltransferase domain-containing protein [Parvularculaceae bacterium]|jgi:cyclopropane fatty-acyl-phospholipid synthase-like methyltransferase|nr:methyltransferase domain-containing protein [Parvularculaceae bacterium]
MNEFTDQIAQLYDRQELSRAGVAAGFYEGSDWLNFGYWRSDTKNIVEACENLVDEILALVPLARGLILDVGCGKGLTARRLLNHFDAADIFGINISREHLIKCEVNAPGCTFLEMDAAQMQFPDESFEHVISVEAAFHFRTRSKFFEEAFRVLRSGGSLMLSDILTDANTHHQPPENRIGDIESYKDLYAAAGFSKVRVIDVTEQCIGGFRRAVLRYLATKVTPAVLDMMSAAYASHGSKKQIYVLACATKP